MSMDFLQVVADTFRLNHNEVNDEMSPDNTSLWDSIRTMELLLAVEQAYGIDLSPTDAARMTSVGETRKMLREKGVSGV